MPRSVPAASTSFTRPVGIQSWGANSVTKLQIAPIARLKGSVTDTTRQASRRRESELGAVGGLEAGCDAECGNRKARIGTDREHATDVDYRDGWHVCFG
jgi:hypothetical protein